MGSKEGEMPKELITSKYSEDDPECGVQVGWGRESSHVQIATVNKDGVQLRPTPEGNGWYVQLGRYEINKLIRTLRRARDAAYGRDE
jgi:hypothetical protein